jgi:digeranylgeranylglycerophospholipid reductase
MRQMRDFDVIVVGGGPGGLAAAGAAARGGARTVLFEQSAEIGTPTRTTGGSFIPDLVELGIPSRCYHPIHTCRFLAPTKSAMFRYPEPVACVLDVHGTFQFLAERAIVSGAQMRVATTVIEPLLRGGTVVGVRARDHRGLEFSAGAKIVIDATGYRCAMLRKAGVDPGFRRFGVGAEYDLYAPRYDEGEAVLIVGSQIAPCGYAWAFPWGNKRVRVGVGIIHADSSAKPEDYLNPLVENAGRFGMNLEGAQPVEYHFGLIPSDGMAEQFVSDGIMSAGDAAGQPSALAGEGIRWAIKAGLMAGRIAGEAVADGDVSRSALSRYEKEWRREYGSNLRIAAEINRRIARWSDEKWDRRTELLNLLTPEQFALGLRTEFLSGWVFQVLRSHPELLREGVKGFVRKLSRSVSLSA